MRCNIHFVSVAVICVAIAALIGQATSQEANDTDIETDTTTTTTTTTSEPEEPPCNFPWGMQGEWRSTIWGDISVQESDIFLNFNLNGDTEGLDELRCYKNIDDTYILRSTTPYSLHTVDFFMFTCVELRRLNNNNYKITIKTNRNQDAYNEPMMPRPTSHYSDSGRNPFDDLCGHPEDDWTHGYMLTDGDEDMGALGCPEALRGEFNVTFVDPITQSRCPGGASMTSCHDPKSLFLNYTTCHAEGINGYQTPDQYVCVGVDDDKVLFYRSADEEDPFTPWSCLEFTVEDQPDNMTEVMANHTDQACGGTWKKAYQTEGVQSESLEITKTGDCTEMVEEVEEEYTTTTAPVVTTESVNVSEETSTGNEENAAPSLVSHGIWFIVIAALTVLLAHVADMD